MSNRHSKMIFEVVGGLGNQLFGVSAGAYFQDAHQKAVSISLREVDQGITAHGVSVSRLKLPFQMIEQSSGKTLFSVWTRRLIFKLDRTLGNRSYFSRKLLHLYRSNVTGYDEFLDKSISQHRIQGYFQSYVYAQALKNRSETTPFNLKEESNWLTEMKRRALAEDPIVLHVRRGDYRNQLHDFGMLSPLYYENALIFLRRSLPHNPIWIFTDELASTQKEFENLDWKNVEWISPPAGVIAEESFVLMQYGIAHVISNSTFSWWAAYASNTSSIVLAPKPWMRNLEEPKTLIPPGWTRVKSDWI